ncbi:15-hydroxyprostaglandin dehydrogenase [Trichonephila clavipes]|nr:15-hydroxyprostaglandin dehydrogenase [Trichonephila clavipes]
MEVGGRFRFRLVVEYFIRQIWKWKIVNVDDSDQDNGTKLQLIVLSSILDNPEAYGPTNLEQPTLNHIQSDTMACAVLADPTRALQGTNRGSGPAMEECENDVGSLKQLLLYPVVRALSCWKIVPGRPFRKGPTWGRRISST